MHKLPDKIIDFHVHLFPDRLFDAIWAYFSKKYSWDVLHHLYYRECVAYLNERDVTPIVYSNYAHKAGVVKGLNEWNIKIVDEIDDLYCFSAFHPDDDDAIEMAKEIISHPKVLGFKLQLLVQQFYPHDERLFPLYELVIEKNKRILFHVGNGPAGSSYVGIENFKHLLKRYPDLPCNVAHMGGLEYKEFFELLDDHEDLYFDTSFSFLPMARAMFNLGQEVLERYKHRILYGSDFPNLIFPREEEIDYLLELDLSQEFYDNIFRENGLLLIERHRGDS